MSDGFHDQPFGDPDTGRDGDFDFLSEWSRSPQCHSGCTIDRVVRLLPSVGSVLCVYREQRPQTSHGRSTRFDRLPVDHPALVALTACAYVRVESSVTSQGPREYLEFKDARDRVQAKVFLLPDTDFLAWDEMVAVLCGFLPPPVEIKTWQAPSRYLRAALLRLGGRWRAIPLRFERVQPTLAARAPTFLSPIGERVAEIIASDERADWCDATNESWGGV